MGHGIGFQGLRGAYSELAILQHFGPNAAKRLRPFDTFEEVFKALTQGDITDALLPFENSLAGAIYDNFDLLVRYPVVISGETILRIRHRLLVSPGTKKGDVTTVISHPQALAQCSVFLRERGYSQQSFFDTAGAARHLSEAPLPHMAAIASEQAAKLYGLRIMSRQIADRGENYTKFFHLRRKAPREDGLDASRKGRHLSLLLLQNGDGFARIGPLCAILQSLGIELVHCEARPTKEAAWTYHYFLEVAASPEHPSWATALMALGAKPKSLRVLGTYWSTR